MFKDLPIKYLLVAGLVIAGILPLLTLSLLSYETAKTELVNAAFNQLESVRKIKSTQISSYFEDKSLQLQHLAESPYLKQLIQSPLKQDEARNYLLDYCKHHQLDNIFLLDAATGVILLSAKESAITVLPIQSSLREVWESAGDGSKLSLSDTTLYSDDAAEPVQFMASGVYQKSQLHAVLVSQLSVMAIDRIMRERSGMGITGETYLAGRDFRMRSDSYLDPLGHSVVASLKGTLKKNGVDTEASRTACLS